MSGWFDKGDDDDDDEKNDTLDDESILYGGEDQLIFLIDAKKRMQSENSQGEIQIVNCMKVASQCELRVPVRFS